MFAVALLLCALVGVSLALLGGGGSLLATPILIFLARLAPSEAVATSLLLVGGTATISAVLHYRNGRVDLRVAAVFGLAGSVGAFLGARGTTQLSKDTLMLSFAGLMVTIGAWMAAGGNARLTPREVKRTPMAVIAVAGLLVGGLTGLLGVGGGFLIVPALLVVCGLPMPRAIGTSLAVIALNAAGGLIGQLRHGEVHLATAAPFAVTAAAGSVVGHAISRRVPAAALRRAFGWFAVVVGLFVAARVLGPTSRVTLPLAGGALIGLAAAMLLYLEGRVAGVSGIAAGLLAPRAGDVLWRASFVAGLAAGGLVAYLIAPGAFAYDLSRSWFTLVGAGVLVGLGTRMANGCTSGHGVCGVSRLSPRSLVATGTFMAVGVAVVLVVNRLLGGAI